MRIKVLNVSHATFHLLKYYCTVNTIYYIYVLVHIHGHYCSRDIYVCLFV